MSENGVKLALDAARRVNPDKSPHITLQELLSSNGDQLTLPAIYRFESKGYFPPDRAKVIAETYNIPVEKLINPRFGSLLDAR